MPCRWYPSIPCSRSQGVGIPACLGEVCSGRVCSGGSALGDVENPLPPRWKEADGYCCGRYASYWNAFLFTLPSIGFAFVISAPVEGP